MSLREDMWKYEQITGESAEHVPIIKLGAFLDGYDMGIKALEQQSFDGKTNGDVIKAMFPSAKIFIDERSAYHYVYVNNPNMGASWKIREDWWNAPYKAESEGEE